VQIHDALTDDARYVLMLARTAAAHGAALASGVRAQVLRVEQGRVCGVDAIDRDSGDSFPIRARCWPAMPMPGPFNSAANTGLIPRCRDCPASVAANSPPAG